MDLVNLFRRGVFAVYKVKHFTSAEIVQQLKETLARGRLYFKQIIIQNVFQ